MTISIHIFPLLFLILFFYLTWFFHKRKYEFHENYFAILTLLCSILSLIWYGIMTCIWLKENITITY